MAPRAPGTTGIRLDDRPLCSIGFEWLVRITDRNEVSVRVMDLTGRASISVDVRTSLGCEMLNEIRAFTWSDARHTLEQPEAWFDELRTSASSDLIAGLD